MRSHGEMAVRAWRSVCRVAQWKLRSIPESDRAKTADYRIWSANRPFVAEVKQLNPNRDEAKLEARARAGERIVFGHEPGDRLRPLISAANRQIRPVARAGEPGLLVVYDTRLVTPVEPYDVLTAMYFLQTVDLQVHPDPSTPLAKVGERFGPKRGVAASYNRAVSAVVIIPQQPRPERRVYIFHNRFADVPFRPNELAGKHIRRFVVSQPHTGEFDDWTEV